MLNATVRLTLYHRNQAGLAVMIGLFPTLTWGQLLTPTGTIGAINTPTAEVLAVGRAAFSLSDSIPEGISNPSIRPTGNINLGIGLLSGLEVAGRLAFAGDINCNAYLSTCNGKKRDLSVGAKYQLPFTLWNDTKLAVGVSDVGGAATHYRQYYGVATSRWQSLEASVGYAKAGSTSALIHGAFGSLRYSLLPQLDLVGEYDSRNTRAGVQYVHRLGESTDLHVAVSRKISGQSSQAANQIQLALNFGLDRSTTGPQSKNLNSDKAKSGASAVPTIGVQEPKFVAEAPSGTSVALAGRSELTASEMAHLLEKAGFANIEVQLWPANTHRGQVWQIEAEARTHRQSHIHAVGQALKPWLEALRQQRVPQQDQWNLTLTYQRQPVLYAQAHGQCLESWVAGEPCTSTTSAPVVLSANPITPLAVDASAKSSMSQVAKASVSPAWMPQLALGPALRTSVGTEYGLLDYSLAAQLGVEVGLAPGLFWQGIYLVPVKSSDDYQDGKVFAGSRFAKSQWHSSQITYWRPLIWGVKAQISAGQISPTDKGSQFDAIWTSPDGRWRASYTGGRYRSDLMQREQVPEFVQLRYSVIPGQWHVEATGGRFMASDTGFKLASVHWFGDTRLSLQYQRTGNQTQTNMPQRAFLGFTISAPIGPKAAQTIGPLTVRGQDRWSWGLQTKVGESDNVITTGYGDFPRTRHGLWTDVIDHDRNGDADLAAQLPRLRGLLRQ